MPVPVDPAELPPLDPRVLQGVSLFNEGKYFLAHEAIEAAWLEEFGVIRPLYQGLIQAAVAMLHLGQHNLHGALKLYRTSRAHLEPFGEVCKGIHVGQLLRDLAALFEPMLRGEQLRNPAAAPLASGFAQTPSPRIRVDAQAAS